MNAIGWGGKNLEQVKRRPHNLQLFSEKKDDKLINSVLSLCFRFMKMWVSAVRLSLRDWEHSHTSLINSMYSGVEDCSPHVFAWTSSHCCNHVCVVGPQSWMPWCLVTSSPYWRPGWPAPSWQSASRATATCCLSADASNRLTSKTRVPERLKHLILYILSHSQSHCSAARSLFLNHSLFPPPFLLVRCYRTRYFKKGFLFVNTNR